MAPAIPIASSCAERALSSLRAARPDAQARFRAPADLPRAQRHLTLEDDALSLEGVEPDALDGAAHARGETFAQTGAGQGEVGDPPRRLHGDGQLQLAGRGPAAAAAVEHRALADAGDR